MHESLSRHMSRPFIRLGVRTLHPLFSIVGKRAFVVVILTTSSMTDDVHTLFVSWRCRQCHAMCRHVDDLAFQKEMLPMHTTIHRDSFLAKLLEGLPLENSRGQPLSRSVPFRVPGQGAEVSALIAAIDNGNDAFKGAIMHAGTPTLLTKRIITAYAPARTIRLGEGITTYQVNDSEPFWMGEDALSASSSESLPVGLTPERLPDERFQAYFAACLVALLIEAGYTPGTHHLSVSFGIPNEEMTLQGAQPKVSQALRLLFNVPFAVKRTDEQGHLAHWNVRLIELAPYPQSFGAFAAWYYTVDGRAIETSVVRHVTLDIGGGQCHDCAVDLEPRSDGRVKLRMSASLLGEGTIAIARAAREAIRARHPGIHLTDAEAQQVLLTRHVIVGGHRVVVDDLVEDVIAARSQHLFTRMLPFVQEGRNFLLFTGGGSVLLEQQLRAMVMPTRMQSQYLFVPAALLPVLNVIGGYVLAQASVQKALAARETSPNRLMTAEMR